MSRPQTRQSIIPFTQGPVSNINIGFGIESEWTRTCCTTNIHRLPRSVIGRQVDAASGKMAVLARAKRGSKNPGGGLTREDEPDE